MARPPLVLGHHGTITTKREDGRWVPLPLYAANSRRTIRTIVSGILQQAVLHKAIPINPVRELEPIESSKEHKTVPPRGLAPARTPVAIAADPPDLVRFAIGTGPRVGEICAVRWMDVNLDGLVVEDQDDMRLVPVVAVRQNVYPVKGKGLAVHGGKTSMALRNVRPPCWRRATGPSPHT
jgi:integrase